MRVDTHVEAGYEVPPHYDSLLCKVIAKGADRAEAIARMISSALGELVCEGVPTTIAACTGGSWLARLRRPPLRHPQRSLVCHDAGPSVSRRPHRQPAAERPPTTTFTAPPSRLEAACARAAPRSTRLGREVRRAGARQGQADRPRAGGALLDPGTAAREVGTFVNYGEVFPGAQRSPAAGVVTAFGLVEGRWCMIIANDNTVASGAWWPRTPEKIQRAQQIALSLRLPTVYLVDCSRAVPARAVQELPGAMRGAGHIFKMNSLLSATACPSSPGCSATASPAAATCRSSPTAST
jgi:hypothetical protein